jgi:hypothetical protein
MLKTIILENVDSIVDRLGTPIDSGIKRAVQIFRTLGFETTGSCEGHLDWGLPYPWIEINTDSSILNLEQKVKLHHLLLKYSNEHLSHLKICDMGIYNGFRIIGSSTSLDNDRIDINNFCDWFLNMSENRIHEETYI